MSVIVKIAYGTASFTARIEYSNRKTLGISVLPDGSVVATAPIDAPIEAIEKKLKKRAAWIKKQRRYFSQFSPRTPPRQYLSGETHLYLGKQYRLKRAPASKDQAADESLKLKGRYFVVSAPDMTPEIVKRLLDTWYRDKAQFVFERRLLKCMSRFPELDQAPSIVIKKLDKRWGSMSLKTRGTPRLMLNIDLIRAPLECIDYVVIHELCHIEQPNHSADFWRLLRIKCPDWQNAKNKLEMKLK